MVCDRDTGILAPVVIRMVIVLVHAALPFDLMTARPSRRRWSLLAHVEGPMFHVKQRARKP